MFNLRTRELKNVAEESFRSQAIESGWEVTKRGWPDFFCIREADHKIAVVEVKKTGSCGLKHEQRIVMATLASFGVEAFHWSPESGFRRIRSADLKQDSMF